MITKSLIETRCFNKARRAARLFLSCAVLVLASLSMLIFSTCDQASLFYNISKETAPKDSIIPGWLSKIVKQDKYLYVANGDLWQFDGNSWQTKISTGDKGPYIYDVAASSTDVYYLTREHSNAEGDTAKIYKRDSSGAATQIGEGSFASDTNLSYCQNIFCVYDGTKYVLFASGPLQSTGSSDSGPQKYSGAGDTWSPVGISGLLEGVVYANGNYYYATTGNGTTGSGGLWKGTSRLKDASGNEIAADIIGIIAIDDISISNSNSVKYLAAVSSSNTIYQINTSDDSVSSVSTGSRFTGALTVWTNPDNPQQRLLLVGYYNFGGDYDNGYREILIKPDGTLNFDTFSMPGSTSNSKPYTTVSESSETFRLNMGRRIVNSIIQYYPESSFYQDTPHPLFASTQIYGLYSYRYRDNNGWVEEWNGEE